MAYFQIWKVFTIALVLRLAFVFLGSYIDESPQPLLYTDIDYYIFSDAASMVQQGKSPYERSTYRYPPHLAFVLIPISWYKDFGKVLFSIADSILASIIYGMTTSMLRQQHRYNARLLRRPKHLKTRTGLLKRGGAWEIAISWSWVMNPISINICSRGSADSITNLLVMLTLVFTLHRRICRAGVIFGLACFMRIYPVIYWPALVVYLMTSPDEGEGEGEGEHGRIMDSKAAKDTVGKHHKDSSSSSSFLLNWLAQCTAFIWVASIFTIVTVVTIGVCCAVSHHYYGIEYWENAVFYHAGREDHRHNFSPYFYWIYLSKGLISKLDELAVLKEQQQQWQQWQWQGVLSDSSFSIGNLEAKDENGFIRLAADDKQPVIYNTALVLWSCSRHTIAAIGGILETSIQNIYVKHGGISSPFLNSALLHHRALLLFIPQLLLLGAIVWRFAAHNLPACLLLQTIVFVAYNKVITAQYFTWFLFLIPVALSAHALQSPCVRPGDTHVHDMLDGADDNSSYDGDSDGNSNGDGEGTISSDNTIRACEDREKKVSHAHGTSLSRKWPELLHCIVATCIVLFWSVTLFYWLWCAYQLEFVSMVPEATDALVGMSHSSGSSSVSSSGSSSGNSSNSNSSSSSHDADCWGDNDPSSIFIVVWRASLLFHCANVLVIVLLIAYFEATPRAV